MVGLLRDGRRPANAGRNDVGKRGGDLNMLVEDETALKESAVDSLGFNSGGD